MKTIFCLLTIVLSATLLYAANGDLIVNGHIGVGPTIQPRSGIYVASTITAVSHQAQGISLVDLNLTAAANNDVLAGIRISPTFTTPQGLTGVKTFGLYVNSLANNFFAGNVGIGTIGPNTALDVEAAPVVNGADRAVLSLGDTTAMAADVGGGLQFVGKYANSGGAAEWAGIKSGKANGTDGDYGAYMAFMTRTNGSATAERMRIDSLGKVGIGTTAPSYTLCVNGTIWATGVAGALSDERHKYNIQSLAISGLDTVAGLRPVTFVWKEPTDDGMQGEQIGFIAQEVEKVLPQAVLTEPNEEGTKGLKYTELIPILTKAIQEQQAQIEALKGRVAALEAAR